MEVNSEPGEQVDHTKHQKEEHNLSEESLVSWLKLLERAGIGSSESTGVVEYFEHHE